MRLSYLFLSAIVGALGTQSGGDDPVPPPHVLEVAPATQPVTSVDAAIEQIRASEAPGSVTDAYSAGLAIDRNNVPLHDAFVHKMVQLDLPKQAGSAAEQLLALQPNNAFARIVVADAEARDGEMSDALTDLALAAPKLPDDRFAQQTAARLFAWYDSAPQKPTLPDSVKQSLDKVRHDWQDLTTFRTSYQEAADFYKNASASQQQPQASQPASQANAPESTAPATAPDQASADESSTPPASYESSPGYSYPEYSSVYTQPEPVYTYAYPSYPVYGSPYYYSYPTYCYPPVIVIDGHRDHHRGRHDDHHGDGHHGDHHRDPGNSFVGPLPSRGDVGAAQRARAAAAAQRTATERRNADGTVSSGYVGPVASEAKNSNTTANRKPAATPSQRAATPAKSGPTPAAKPAATPSANPGVKPGPAGASPAGASPAGASPAAPAKPAAAPRAPAAAPAARPSPREATPRSPAPTPKSGASSGSSASGRSGSGASSSGSAGRSSGAASSGRSGGSSGGSSGSSSGGSSSGGRSGGSSGGSSSGGRSGDGSSGHSSGGSSGGGHHR